METIQVKMLGFKGLNYNVPSSVEEFDQLAGRAGAAKDEAVKNVYYRSVANQARYGFLHGFDEEKNEDGSVKFPKVDGLDTLTGIDRKVKVTKPEVKDAEGKITQEEVSVWAESEETFSDRVFATLATEGKFPSAEAAQANYAYLAQAALDRVEFDPKKTARESAGPKKTPKTYVSIAEEIVKRAGSVEAAVARFNAKTGRNVEPTLEALAKGVWEDQAAQKKAIAEGYAS